MTKYERLEALYATLPTVNCKKLCQNYCGPILIPKIEAHRMEERRGFLQHDNGGWEGSKRASLPAPEIIKREFVALTPDKDMRCVFLVPLTGRCWAYTSRPLVCRVWGCMDNPHMRCPHGCVPTRWVTDDECKQLYERIIEIQNEPD